MGALSTRTACRLYAILATDAPVGIILRRGPSRWVRLIKWNTKTDTFESGQWFHGRIYEDCCDLSPDGTKFAYFATKYNKRTMAADKEITFAWTALSLPPYLTALALWPSDRSTWYGDSFFESNSFLKLNLAPGHTNPHPDHLPPNKLKTEIASELTEKRRNSRGWTYVDGNYWHQEKKRPPGKYKLALDSGAYSLTTAQAGHQFEFRRKDTSEPYSITGLPLDDVHFRLVKHASWWQLHLEQCTWADWDHRGHLVFASRGKLFRSKVDRHGIAAADKIADFNAMEPEAIMAPGWAKRWD